MKKENVDRSRPEVKTLPGTRKLHSIKNTGTDLIVKVRELSCFCQACFNRDRTNAQCLNHQYVSPYEEKTIQLTNPVDQSYILFGNLID